MDIRLIVMAMVLSGCVPTETRRPGAWDRATKTREYRRSTNWTASRRAYHAEYGHKYQVLEALASLDVWDGYDDHIIRGGVEDERAMYEREYDDYVAMLEAKEQAVAEASPFDVLSEYSTTTTEVVVEHVSMLRRIWAWICKVLAI